MKPSSESEYHHEPDRPMRSVTLASATGAYSRSNRRVSPTCGAQRCYPWLLVASTAVAAVFCFAYITKPVVIHNSPISSVDLENAAAAAEPETSLESGSALQDPAELADQTPARRDSQPSDFVPAAPNSRGFEETNLRMQHILDAESPSGGVHRLVIDVPVLYKNRNLRWSQLEVAQARILLQRLEQHQEQTRALRDQGKLLLETWNSLIEASIPDQVLRADSPSLPINQRNNKMLPIAPSSDAVKLQQDTK